MICRSCGKEVNEEPESLTDDQRHAWLHMSVGERAMYLAHLKDRPEEPFYYTHNGRRSAVRPAPAEKPKNNNVEEDAPFWCQQGDHFYVDTVLGVKCLNCQEYKKDIENPEPEEE